MVTTSTVEHLNDLLRRAGSDMTVRLCEDGTGVYYSGDFEEAKTKLANLVELTNRGEAQMADTAIDEFWALTDQMLKEDPKLHPSEARKLAIEQHPTIALAAGVPGAGRARKNSTAPPGNSAFYVEKFMALAYQREREKNITDQQARLEIARDFPALRGAAFGADPKTRFFGAVRYEAEQNKLDLSQAYRTVALHLPQDSLEVL